MANNELNFDKKIQKLQTKLDMCPGYAEFMGFDDIWKNHVD